jgi:hypothetical protein
LTLKVLTSLKTISLALGAIHNPGGPHPLDPPMEALEKISVVMEKMAMFNSYGSYVKLSRDKYI